MQMFLHGCSFALSLYMSLTDYEMTNSTFSPNSSHSGKETFFQLGSTDLDISIADSRRKATDGMHQVECISHNLVCPAQTVLGKDWVYKGSATIKSSASFLGGWGFACIFASAVVLRRSQSPSQLTINFESKCVCTYSCIVQETEKLYKTVLTLSRFCAHDLCWNS